MKWEDDDYTGDYGIKTRLLFCLPAAIVLVAWAIAEIFFHGQ